MTQPTQGPSAIPPMEMPENLEPVYSNIVRISHTPSEMIIDFSRLLPSEPKFKVLSRVVMSPVAAKLLYRAIGENIARYEAAFGEIRTPGGPDLASDLFRQVIPPKPPESE